MIVVDTNVLSELVRRQPDPVVLDWLDARIAEDLAITSISVAELLYGVARLPDGKRKRALAEAVAEMVTVDFAGRVLPFDGLAAACYAELVSARERAGRPIGMADGQIAAICLAEGAALATRNGRDFEGIGIELFDPWRAPDPHGV